MPALDHSRSDDFGNHLVRHRRNLSPRARIAAVRAVVQRVTSASVAVGGEVIGTIEPGPGRQGLLVLLGVTHDDDADRAARLARKIWELRILDDGRSASDVDAPLLVVSQFTLYADTRKGRRPSWSAAAPGKLAEPLVDAFCDALRSLGAHVETGVFGAMMQVTSTNDGPVTLLLES
jgi:D-tyrosyl-tRNA(Tyr) deacylase